MTRYTYWLIALICLFSTVRANAFEIQPTTPDPRASIFDAIKTAPTNSQDLTPYYSMSQDGDGIGEELPSSIMYFKRNTKEYTTYMTVTDLSLCKRPIERRICQSFVKMITEAPPALGTEVSDTRIGGADFGTVYLSRIDSVKLDGVDISTAFIGIDSQDPPRGTIALYIYAKKSTNLIQLTVPVTVCEGKERPNQSDISYYRQYCVNKKIIADAKSRARQLTELFKLLK